MRIIDADKLPAHKFQSPVYLARKNGKIILSAYQKGWNDAIDAIVDNEPTVEQECYITGAQWDEFMKEHKRPKGKLIIKNHMETCEQCGSVMPMMNDYYRAKLRGCPYCLTEFTNLADMRGEKP